MDADRKFPTVATLIYLFPLIYWLSFTWRGLIPNARGSFEGDTFVLTLIAVFPYVGYSLLYYEYASKFIAIISLLSFLLAMFLMYRFRGEGFAIIYVEGVQAIIFAIAMLFYIVFRLFKSKP